ncbi:OLC1v1032265C1 [Oldenlandia corymbosa var. corymbosa]|uniref:poly(A)-specific ribonuclease n=1 Tax=Oldenlandia corymbosa var. corymbosa TaxID=529605 RepID=A0AAV1CMG5_OLDCO|nr:OLC1v1032265C1 [Oldenlandia corymbosa var. corymbosa]
MADWGDIAQTSRVNDNSQGNGGNFNPQNKVCDFCKYVGHTRDQCFKLNRPSRGERARYRKKKRQKRTDGQKLPKKDAYLEMCKIILAPESSHEELLHYTRDSPPHVREVHQENLEEEFKVINGILGQFNFASVDTEFPGSPYSPGVKTENKLDAAYSSLKKNVDALHLIQLGVTFSDRHAKILLQVKIMPMVTLHL